MDGERLTKGDEDRLLGIRSREAKATIGPWFWEFASPGHILCSGTVEETGAVVLDGKSSEDGNDSNVIGGKNDRAFVEHAREDIPYLLGLIGRLMAVPAGGKPDAPEPKFATFGPFEAFDDPATGERLYRPADPDNEARCYLCVHKSCDIEETFVESQKFVYWCGATKPRVLCGERNPDGKCGYFKKKDFDDPSGS